jgi:hypothetical protein
MIPNRIEQHIQEERAMDSFIDRSACGAIVNSQLFDEAGL